jgi:FixJ family two-component response regulator
MADTQQRPLIALVDDDESVRESLPELLWLLGFSARPFVSAQAFLESDAIGHTRCLISDVSMPSMSGPQLQREVNHRKLNIPIIFITGRRDPGLRTSVLANGAVECLFKPLSEKDLLSALHDAMATP